MKFTRLSFGFWSYRTVACNCELGWFEAIVYVCVFRARVVYSIWCVFVLQRCCGDEMTDELAKQGKLSKPKSFGKIERIYLYVLLGNIIMFCKWLFYFYSCRQPRDAAQQRSTKCQSNSISIPIDFPTAFYQIWYYILCATVINYLLIEINPIKKMKSRYRLCLHFDEDGWWFLA